MKWYVISCPICGWATPDVVSEDVAKNFHEKLRYCQDCKQRGVKVEFQYRETITSTRGVGHGHRRTRPDG